ncbi:Cytidylate kinase [Cucumispora dikerogammari]|nr:Cytidylate kinase [Cucumispora dikerogammari]
MKSFIHNSIIEKNNMDKFMVAIDGTSASGKSTIAKFIGKELGFTHVNSGNLYRSISAFFCIYYIMDFEMFGKSLKVSDAELDAAMVIGIKTIKRTVINEEQLMKILYDLVANKMDEVGFNLCVTNHVYNLNGYDITKFIRSILITDLTVILAQIKILRVFSNNLLRSFIRCSKRIVCDGRDIGTNVIPNAQLKLFVICDAEIRAKRRLLEMDEPDINFDKVLANIKLRDRADVERKAGPLKKAEDAVVFDTGNRTEAETFDAVLEIVRCKMIECGFD